MKRLGARMTRGDEINQGAAPHGTRPEEISAYASPQSVVMSLPSDRFKSLKLWGNKRLAVMRALLPILGSDLFELTQRKN